VFTQARSAAYIGCRGSIPSGTPTALAWARRGKTSDDKDQTLRADRGGFIEGALVVIDGCRAAGRVRRRKEAAAAQSGHAHAAVLQDARRFRHPLLLHLIAPGIDRGNTHARTSFHRFAQIPLFAHGRQIDRETVDGHSRYS
jgi:hypothetical protein